MTISEIFKKMGEKFFRMEEEKEVLKSLEKNNRVVALGGGAFMNNVLRENILKNFLNRHRVFFFNTCINVYKF